MVRIPITLTNSAIRNPHVPVPKAYRNHFPPYHEEFVLETTLGDVVTYMTSSLRGDNDGKYFSRGMTMLFHRLPELRAGTQVFIEVVVPMERYKLCC